jgi:hypothetical protein
LNDNRLFPFDHLGVNFLLLGRLQIAFVLRLLAHALHSGHHITLLREKRIAQIGRPLQVICEPLHQVGHRRQRLYARVPLLLRYRIGQRLVL